MSSRLFRYCCILTFVSAFPLLFQFLADPVPAIAQSHNSGRVVRMSGLSLVFPEHWIVETANNSGFTVYNQQPPRFGGGVAPPYFIRTNGGFVDNSLDGLVRYSVSNESPSGTTFIKRENLEIDGRRAVRVWNEEIGSFTHSIITYVYYNNTETVSVVSYYSRENTAAEAAIVQIHNSLAF